MAGAYYIGTSGWSYPHWQHNFYQGIAKKQWLSYYATQFNSIEINATFYRQQSRATFERWAAQVPDDFRFAIKGHRYLTHNLKLSKADQPLQRQRAQAQGLGNKLAVVLWQLPHNLKKNIKRLQDFSSALQMWQETRHAIEFRHSSWFDDEVADCLNEHRIAVCQSDAVDWPYWDRVTTDLVYVRLHGHVRTYVSSYDENALCEWAQQCQQWLQQHDVYLYFDNDAEAAAPKNALRLIELLKQKVFR